MIDLRGDKELLRELEKLQAGPLNKTLQKGTDAGGKFLKPRVKAAAPRRTGRLRKAISSRKARGRPATIVYARAKVAFYRHMVIGGTRPHRIRFPDQKARGTPKSQGNIRHPGAKANPFIERTADHYERAALDIAVRAITKELP